MLLGANATKDTRTRAAEMIQRPACPSMPNGAPAQTIEATLCSGQQMTAIQRAYLSAIAKTKIESKTTTGAQSWVGRAFG